jgi:hypothetical protein
MGKSITNIVTITWPPPIDIRLEWGQELGLSEGVPRQDGDGKGILGLGDGAEAAELHHIAHPEPILRVVRLVFLLDALQTVELGWYLGNMPMRCYGLSVYF